MPRSANSPPAWHAYASHQQMSQQLAVQLANELQNAIAKRGSASMAVSGGSTPADLYRALSATDLNWSKVNIVLIDERWVDPGEAGSNQDFIQSTLLKGQAAAAKFIGLKTNSANPYLALHQVRRRLRKIALPFDVCVFGLGSDGHTASWFPHANGLSAALDPTGPLVHAIKALPSEVTGPFTDRITLGLAAFANARHLHLMFTGEQKQQTWHQALQDGPIADMPVRALIANTRKILQVHWAP